MSTDRAWAPFLHSGTGFVTLFGFTGFTLWWVCWTSDMWGIVWAIVFVPDWNGDGEGARECPSRSDCSSLSNNLLFCSFNWAISSACRWRSSSRLFLSSSWRSWSMTPFWSNSCIWIWRVCSMVLCSSEISLLLLFAVEPIFKRWDLWVWE